jgi:Ca-activated chloride channel family protein
MTRRSIHTLFLSARTLAGLCLCSSIALSGCASRERSASTAAADPGAAPEITDGAPMLEAQEADGEAQHVEPAAVTLAEESAPRSERRRNRGPARGGRAYKKDLARNEMPIAPTPVPMDETFATATFDTEGYDHIAENDFRTVADEPLSTFSIDVDTASYSNVRRFLNDGSLPPSDAVRVEELVNYFDYEYARPDGDVPFSMTAEVSECPWNPDARLVHLGLQGKQIAPHALPPRNLVFLLDVSGSMDEPDKLPLLVESMKMLVAQLDGRDRVAIVVYAGASGVVLEPTRGDDHATLMGALDRLHAGGSTNGGSGIELAYALARDQFVDGGINRVILATDGDFNVGTTSRGELERLIERERRSGVFLSVLGFGTGNMKDSQMEMLADKGNGNYAYIDTAREARKVLVEEAGSTLVTIAKDVKIQVEFNPAQVASYRLVGYENRALANRDFNDDTKDAGEIGAGHSVTALYEVVLAERPARPEVDPLRYQQDRELSAAAGSGELMLVKLRYKQPNGVRSKLTSFSVRDSEIGLREASTDFRFAAAVAEFGMLLRQSPHARTGSFAQARSLAEGALGRDEGGHRREFVALVERAAALAGERGPAIAR